MISFLIQHNWHYILSYCYVPLIIGSASNDDDDDFDDKNSISVMIFVIIEQQVSEISIFHVVHEKKTEELDWTSAKSIN